PSQRYFPFDLPAGALSTALASWSSQTGIAITTDLGQLTNRSMSRLQGSYTAEAALSQLLAGTGVTYRFATPTGVQLLTAPASTGSIAWPAVQVTGDVPQETADGPVEGYRATRSATGTFTDTALRDTPQSIQVVPRQVIEDQQATRLI